MDMHTDLEEVQSDLSEKMSQLKVSTEDFSLNTSQSSEIKVITEVVPLQDTDDSLSTTSTALAPTPNNAAAATLETPIIPAVASEETPIMPAAASEGTPIMPVAASEETPIMRAASSGETPIMPAAASEETPIMPAAASGETPIPPKSAKMFVGGLSWTTTINNLIEYFSKFGKITEAVIVMDPLTGRSRGFGFITFSEEEAVEKVLQVTPHTIDGRPIEPKHFIPKAKYKSAMLEKTKKVFVGGVHRDTTSEELKAYFEKFGSVEDINLLYDSVKQRHRGFGFITFENEDVVEQICHIHFHLVNGKTVECKKPHSKMVEEIRVIPGQMIPAPQQMYRVKNGLARSNGKLVNGNHSVSNHRYSPYPIIRNQAIFPSPPPSFINLGVPTMATYNPFEVNMMNFYGID